MGSKMEFLPGNTITLDDGTQLEIIVNVKNSDEEIVVAAETQNNKKFYFYRIERDEKKLFSKRMPITQVGINTESKGGLEIASQLAEAVRLSNHPQREYISDKIRQKMDNSKLMDNLAEKMTEEEMNYVLLISEIAKTCEIDTYKAEKVYLLVKESKIPDSYDEYYYGLIDKIKGICSTSKERANQVYIEAFHIIEKSENNYDEKSTAGEKGIDKSSNEEVFDDAEDPRTDHEYYKLYLNNGRLYSFEDDYLWRYRNGYLISPYEAKNHEGGEIYVIATKHGDHFRDIILKERIDIDKEGIGKWYADFKHPLPPKQPEDSSTVASFMKGKLTCYDFYPVGPAAATDILLRFKDPVFRKTYADCMEKSKNEYYLRSMYRDLKKKEDAVEQEFYKTKEDLAYIMKDIRVKK